MLNEDGYSSTIKDKILTIDVRPGWRQGTRITFEKEGDQVRGREAGSGSQSPGSGSGGTEREGTHIFFPVPTSFGLELGGPQSPFPGTERPNASVSSAWGSLPFSTVGN